MAGKNSERPGKHASTRTGHKPSAELTRARGDTLPLPPICYSSDSLASVSGPLHSTNDVTKHVVTGRVIGLGRGERRVLADSEAWRGH